MKIKTIAANQTVLEIGNGKAVFFSYETPVAALTDSGYVRTDKKWSPTTTLHINKWLNKEHGSSNVPTVPQEELNSLVNDL